MKPMLKGAIKPDLEKAHEYSRQALLDKLDYQIAKSEGRHDDASAHRRHRAWARKMAKAYGGHQ